mgnify:CR=1 FL=1
MSFIKLTDLDLAGKRVLIRADLNVPVKDGKVTSDARITASMPTIEHCMKAGAKVMVMSHRGRPEEGVADEENSMQQIADEAGINKALLHYHFRNKETLYGMIFKEALGTLKANESVAITSNVLSIARAKSKIDGDLRRFGCVE